MDDGFGDQAATKPETEYINSYAWVRGEFFLGNERVRGAVPKPPFSYCYLPHRDEQMDEELVADKAEIAEVVPSISYLAIWASRQNPE